jgi:hypothetical protein
VLSFLLMTGLPRAIIKKYGVSKKAWSVFRRSKKSRRTISKPVKFKRLTSMRHKRTSKRGFFSKAKSSINTNGLIMGAAAVAVVEPFIDQAVSKISSFAPLPANIIKAGVGWFAAKNSNKLIKGTGLALLVLGVHDTVSSYTRGSAVSASSNYAQGY